MAYNANDVAQLGHLASLTAKFRSELGKLDNAKVDKIEGKGLSTNDFDNTYKGKLDSIEAGAQVNVIETVKLNNAALTVDSLKAVNIDLSDYALKADIASGVKVKGSVASFDVLPANAEVGDMYHIVAAGGTDENGVAIKAGDNVVKTATGWDNFGGTVDLSNYVQKDGQKVLSTYDFDATYKGKLDNIEAGAQVNLLERISIDGAAATITDKGVNIVLAGKVDTVAGKGLSTEDYTTAEKTKLAGVEAGAQVNIIEGIKLNNSALAVDASKAVNIDITGKMDKVTGATQGNIAVFGADGIVVDSGFKFATNVDVNAMLEEYFPSV